MASTHNPGTAEPKPEAQLMATRARMRVLAWLCAFSAITYVGRVCVIQVQDDIQRDLHLGPAQFAFAFSAFSLAYAFFEIPTGWLGDRLGARKVLTRIAMFWIAFTALTGAVWNLPSIVVVRFLFGTGEAGAFPNIARASREWFPFNERGYAQGMVWAFARWGGAIAPFLMMLAAYPFGWRGGFVILSVLALLWLWPFRRFYRDKPELDPRVNAAELAYINAGKAEVDKPAPLSWSSMLGSPTLWALSAMYFCSNAGWSFFATWITPYLHRDLKLSGLTLVLASGGPLLFGGIACLLGGSLTDRQVRVWGRRWGRTLQGVIAYGLGGALLIVAVLATPSHVGIAYWAICLSSFIKDFGMPASWSTSIDVGHRYSGTVAGVMNTVGNLGQVVTIPIVAWLAIFFGTAGHPAWKVSLYYYSAMFFIASAAWLFVDPRRVIVYTEEDRQRLGL
jgi:MFS transporter, ACS family, glucarate transporter